ncbi:NAD-dependent DNA ligase LigA [Mycoplasma sp. 1018B]|uniref:NAD-dependent DNA ligase LigA n=1 Tax=Mycoplasma sp. 1018B TaxID=2967302 RepID=UPI00211BA997|nr:NAD-dependent DNA ligase LigA [Mycoplasma sp. 1018B]UUM19044.1 NAD-dependent DNA ligase LigA [Mycoplasma sp. 1018B]
MEQKDIKEKIKILVNNINRWNHEYYDLDNPTVSDLEYDLALRELEKLEQFYPNLILDDSPTKKIGSKTNNKFKKFKHKKPMLSLNKAYNYEEISKFLDNILKIVPINDVTLFLEPKIDGLSISLHYDKGQLIRAVTRGDGVEGEEVTENVLAIDNKLKSIMFFDYIEIRGEIFLSKEKFKELNEISQLNNEKTFANPRNAASGTLRQLDSTIVKERGLSLFLYEIVEPEKYGLKTQHEVINFIKNISLPINDYFKIVDIEDLEEEINNFSLVKNNLPYDSDGLVIKLNNLIFWEKLGKTSKFPKHSIAFKYEVEQAKSKILGIKATVGRTGKITYIASIEPVELNQTIVQNATLHNFNFIKTLNIDIGDEVAIIKAGEIIPKIIANQTVKNTLTSYKKIIYCPSCNEKLIEYENNVDQFCLNKKCPDIIINSIIHFASRKSMNITGLGENTVKDLYKANILKSIIDIFNLEQHKEKITSLPKYGELKVNNLLENIEKIKNTEFAKVLFAIGIKHVGQRASQIFAHYYKNFSELIDDKNLQKINNSFNIGPKIILSVKKYLNDTDNIELLKQLDKQLIFVKKNDVNLQNTKLNNLTFVVTGKLTNSRDYYQNLIEKNGGKVLSNISNKTDYLLVGDNAGSKLIKAQKLNIKTINETDFLNLLED